MESIDFHNVTVAYEMDKSYSNIVAKEHGNDSNVSVDDVAFNLEAIIGPKRHSLSLVVPITIIYCAIFVIGIFGNVCTCIVIARNRFMHTATNYYLFNLAVSDLLLLILGLPQELYSTWSFYPWVFGKAFCVIRIMTAEASTYASILTITAFTVERYVAIVHPMKAQAVSSLPRAIKMIVVIWIFAAISSIPTGLLFDVVYITDHNNRTVAESAMCRPRHGSSVNHTFEVSTFLFFVAPMTVITVLYLLIGLAVRRSASLSRSASDSSTNEKEAGHDHRRQQVRARRSVLKMLGKLLTERLDPVPYM